MAMTVAQLAQSMNQYFDLVLARLDGLSRQMSDMEDSLMSNAGSNQQALDTEVGSLTTAVSGMRTDLQAQRDKIDQLVTDLEAQATAGAPLDFTALRAAVATLGQERTDVQGFDPTTQTGINAPGAGETPATPAP